MNRLLHHRRQEQKLVYFALFKARTRAGVSLYEVGDWWLQIVFQLKKYNAPLRDQEKML